MTNFEKNIEKIRELVSQGHDLAVRNGEIGICRMNEDKCDYCDFDKKGETCSLATLKWLLEDDGEPSPERKAGQEEAWGLAKKIGTIYADGDFLGEDMKEIFGVSFIYEVFESHSYAEAAAKVKAWEDGKEIKVGDVVKSKQTGFVGVVTGCTDPVCDVMTETGDSYSFYIKDCTKTGRTLPAQDWLRQIEGGRMGGQEDIQEPERRRGHWIDGETYYDAIERNCSECGGLLTTAKSQKPPFCPHCGAIMDGGVTDEHDK